jgi:hypothetical protein
MTGSVLATYTTSKIPTASTSVLGLVKVDGTSITIAGGVISGASTYTLPATTTTALGGVVIPAVGTSGITNTSGTIGLATATTTQLGGVKIDNNTIVINSGVISVGGALTSATIFKGSWDASSNTPTLSNSLPAGVQAGWQYIVSVQGTRDIGAGSTAYTVGDLVIYNGTSWSRIPGGNSVTAFNTRQGSITLLSSDVTTALGTQVTKTFFSGPISGADATPTFRTIAATDIPSLTSSQLATILSDETGTGVVVFGTSPAITTSITTASTSFDLLNTTATTVNFAGAATTALNIGASGAPITGFAATATTASTASSLGYLGLPQSATSTTATLTIGDAGKHIYVKIAGQTITIPDNSVVPYPIGTAITFIAGGLATTVTIANNDTMYLVGAGTSGTRTLAAYGTATAIKVASSTWFINGSGLT